MNRRVLSYIYLKLSLKTFKNSRCKLQNYKYFQRSVSRMWNAGPEYLEGKIIGLLFRPKREKIYNKYTNIAKKMLFLVYIIIEKV